MNNNEFTYIKEVAKQKSFSKTFSNEHISYFPLINFDSNTQKFGAKFNVPRFNNDNEVFLRLK